ncbi:MAG TPA: 16S rRNA (cytidine(1402)-2'-O)-methyltransferase [Elusimicrobia bacterium]|nr:MAG: 16S rRNA (cytidine(1402)-2'-O)-methyltransferase [Elusimicrobia bacterium RIFOXYA12_FULL_49_49]OGS11611.1 MAG: 16S rRNA (cytidine(1402)-2'-O)-methyltransferase [Elusimicrobia bacterium RIFOXYB1_FULL_48_9]OGS14961.1 MAG: 16S rRNA (cytidine(1402)-2'-O)-methyltransferase [Elusimicrobia bacterium RIFOXYA2_FULL_47_53]OGS26104.1 MAG: 16S rRNA (cytidine(1402)-2'-O)-methyltransferase [Elusimicrobia bacterium RIFOXYB12_FULL_50_12]OGS29306.1 MAG: 16S rRNA (cytidine(1402)-2'-O)-methyltransferase [
MGTLYIVPTPIGNLDDITIRALNVLKSVDFIACEDTRHSAKLLNHFGIKKPLLSFYSYNQSNRAPQIIKELSLGKNAALISDSGTPCISDPGFYLVNEAIAGGINIVPLPGPSAVLTALVASGLPTENFVFLGFLKRKPGKLKKELKQAALAGATVVFYESPHRLKKTLGLLLDVFGSQSRVAVARELTKKFEEFVRGTLGEVAEIFNNREILGEFVVMVSPENNATEKDNE